MAETFEVVKARTMQREKAVRDVLLTQEGTALLRALEELFYDCDLLGATPQETAFKLGQREVVVYLRAAREQALK